MLLLSTAFAFTVETSDRTLEEGLPAILDGIEACTGRAPAVADTLVAERVHQHGASGAVVPLFDEEGRLSRLEVGGGVDNVVVSVALAGAVFEMADRGVWTGRSYQLARCVAPGIGGVLPLSAENLSTMPDLRAWQEVDLEHRATLQEGSARLFEAITVVLGPEAVFAEGFDTWIEFDEALAAAGEPGAKVLAATSSLEAQRLALSDPDRDGWSTLYEELTGTDPLKWDSDGDGWWDGAEPAPEGAVLLPPDASTICIERIPEGAEHVTLVHHGRLLGFAIDGKVQHGVPIDHPLRLSPDWVRRPGGVWVEVQGEGLVDNPVCGLSENLTIRDETRRFPKLLRAVQPHLVTAFAELDAILGPSSRRANVVLAERATTLVMVTTSPNTSDPAVMIPVHRGYEARKKEQLDFLAAQAAALFRFAEIEALTDAAAAGAFGSWLTGRGVPNSPLVEASRSEVKAWLKRVERCGWEALAQGACP